MGRPSLIRAEAGTLTVHRLVQAVTRDGLGEETAKGQIIFGGLAPFPEAGAVGHFGILGGTDAFRKARGDATLVVLSIGDSDTILDLE